MDDLMKNKWRSHVCGARRRGIKGLTFDEYRGKLIEAGISPEQIGNASSQYQLARKTDKGDYTVDSCRFITMLENQKERITNGGAAKAGAKNRAIRTGMRKETHPHVALAGEKIRQTITGRTAKDFEYIARRAVKLAKPYSFLSPDGVVYTGKNLSEFCREMNLQQPRMTAVKVGRQRHHKGWTLYQESQKKSEEEKP